MDSLLFKCYLQTFLYPEATNVRLSGGSHTMEGRVEIMKDGTWSTLCDDGWVDNEATIICKMLTPYPLNRYIKYNIRT